MNIAVLQATSQNEKNKLIYLAAKKYALGSDIYNFGCSEKDICTYSYVDISLLIGLLLASRSIDFVITGCSSGQGMMLACNSMLGVLCGYVPNAVVILGMTIFPCLGFLCFAIDRKNNIAIIPISIFAICHLIYGIVNYII